MPLVGRLCVPRLLRHAGRCRSGLRVSAQTGTGRGVLHEHLILQPQMVSTVLAGLENCNA